MQPDIQKRRWQRNLLICGVLSMVLFPRAYAVSYPSLLASLPWLCIGGGLLLLVVGGLLTLFVIHYRRVRKHAEASDEYRQIVSALRESEQRYRHLVECSPDAIVVHCDGYLVFVNSATVKLLKARTDDDLIGKPVLDFVHPASQEVASSRIQHALHTGEKLPLIEERFRRFDGTVIDVEVTATPLRYQGKPAIQVVIRDISARKRAEQRLRDSEERYRALSELISDFAYVLQVYDDHSFRDEWVSESFVHVTGYTVEEARQLNWIGLLHPDDVQRAVAGIPNVLAGVLSQAEFRIVTKDGRIRWLHVYNQPAWDVERRRIVKIYGAAQDITERKQTEIEIRTAHQDAERANKAKDLFLAGISHELRTPLNAILGYAQLLGRNGHFNAKEREKIETIRRSGEHLLKTINEILDFSKIEAQKIELEICEFSLPDVLSSVIDMVQVQADQQGILFQPEIARNLPHVVAGDEQRLRQILLNLLNNAVKFTDVGAVVFQVCRCPPSDDHVGPNTVACLRFQVEDQGIGIAPDDLSEIFQPFQQIGDKRFYAQGIGLGLAISQRFVAMMGGELHVTSVPGQGSIFWFELLLPEVSASRVRANTQPQSIIGMRRRQVKSGDHMPESRPLNILVVDDNIENREMMRDMLEPLGCVVSEAEHGQAAVEYVEENHPDLVLMDLMMPVMDGIQAAGYIRQHSNNDDIAIIGISANIADEVRRQCLEAGCQAFLAKPFDMMTLLQYVQQYAPIDWIYGDDNGTRGGARQPDPPVLKQGDAEETPAELPPPADIVRELYNAATSGDIAVLRKHAQRLREQQQCSPFLEKLDTLMRSYQMNKITRFLSTYM